MRVFTVAAAVALLGACGGSETAPAGGMAWRDGGELDAAFAEAKSSGKPLMVYFTAVW